jgi:hypothetical protein
MGRQHSDLFNTPNLVRSTDKAHSEQQLNPELLQTLINNEEPLSYEAVADLLKEVNDAQFGIVSKCVTSDDGEIQWLRDATLSIDLDQRMPHDAPVIEANNMLLRTLSRLRPIDYAIGKKLEEKDSQVIQQQMRQDFANLSQEILTIAQDNNSSNEAKLQQIKDKETEFNSILINQLHKANLTPDVTNAKDAEKLLFHYRNMSSVLSPARTMITLTYDKEAQVLQRETQYPVTKKTEKQKEAIAQLEQVIPYPTDSEKNAHTQLKPAQQVADQLFANLIAQDDTALPAQTRKTHLASAKNAFIVKNELIFNTPPEALTDLEAIDKLKASEEDTLWLVRMGSPTYVGKGESAARLKEHTIEILKQIRDTAQEKMGGPPSNIHVTTLNTYTFLENQATIIRNIEAATRSARKGDNYSYLPTNWDGTNRLVNIAPELDFKDKAPPSGSAPSQKEKRLESVSKVMLAAAQTNNTLSAVHCASGQDRTGTAIEKTVQDWMKERYKSHRLTITNIENTRAKGGNAAEITSHHVHGSPGMKKESQAGNTFSAAANEQFYRSSAGTNKKNKVGDVTFLNQPSEQALNEYYMQLTAFKECLNSFKTQNLPGREQLQEQGKNLAHYIEERSGNQFDPKPIDAKTLFQLTQVLSSTTKTLQEVDDPEQTKQNVKTLAKISKNVSGKSTFWEKIGLGLLVVGCAALVCIGVLAAIPSGGSSLLLSALGVAGLSAAMAGGVGATATGIALENKGQEKNLAKEVSKFKSALKEIEKEQKVNENEEEIIHINTHP